MNGKIVLKWCQGIELDYSGSILGPASESYENDNE